MKSWATGSGLNKMWAQLEMFLAFQITERSKGMFSQKLVIGSVKQNGDIIKYLSVFITQPVLCDEHKKENLLLGNFISSEILNEALHWSNEFISQSFRDSRVLCKSQWNK